MSNPSNQSKPVFNLFQFIKPSQNVGLHQPQRQGQQSLQIKYIPLNTQKFKESIDSFQAAIDLLLQSHPKQSLDNITEIGKLYVILNINAAFAALNLKTKEYYQKAEVYCSDALSIDPKNQKGLFRRGLANKEFAQLLEVESNGTAKELLALNEKAKRDFEDVVILDRTNDLAQKKLTEVIKNLYRITVSQGKEANLSSKEVEKKERSSVNTKVQEKKEETKVVKKSGDMNKILKEYRVDEVTQLARAKVQQQYLTQELPKTRAELEKAIREIGKSEDVLLQFIYRMSDDYLKKIQPTFDMLFHISGIIIKKGEGESAKNAFLVIKSQKAFDLLWKSYSGGEKKQFIEKWTSLGLSEQAIK